MNRRKFIKVTTIASASLLPISAFIAYQLNESQESDVNDKLFDKELNFHLLDNNLLNLHFYFLNCKKKGKRLIPQNESLKSFMIVRLPQMHVSEKGFWQSDWSDGIKQQSNAFLSGFSYLAFHLWPNHSDTKGKELKFNLDTVLNWNDDSRFELVTLVEWLRFKLEDDFIYTEFETQKFNDRKVWNKSIVDIDKEFTDNYYTKLISEPAESIYKKYKSIIRHLLDQNLVKNQTTANTFIPITFFEVPQAVCLVPISTQRDSDTKQVRLKKNFWSNKFAEKYTHGYRKYEVWHNTLFYTSRLQDTTNSHERKNKEKSRGFKIQTPSFRVAGLITDKEVCIGPACDINISEDNIYPTLLNKAELAYLTQLAKAEINHTTWNFSDPAYDITTTTVNKDLNLTESHGFFFSGLGIITHLRYYNENCPAGIDLIEYEHIITEGRDILVKLAKIGIHNKNGKRYKHVIEAKRKINTVYDNQPDAPLQSFIELKQYCECLEETKSYEFAEADVPIWNEKNYDTPQLTTKVENGLDIPDSHPLFTPVINNSPHFRRFPWKLIHTFENKRIPIETYQDNPDGTPISIVDPANALWFWPIHEGSAANPIYYESKSTAYDWDNGSIEIETPFIFIRKTVLERNDVSELKKINNSYFQLIKEDSYHPLNLRRQIATHNNKIGFTEPLPPEQALSGPDQTPNKINILETEFVETYFNVDNQSIDFNLKRFPILPQLLRAKVFVDHIHDLTLQKISSVVEYHLDYLQNKLSDFQESTKQGNPAKLILANTDAFMGIQLKKVVEGGVAMIISTNIPPYEEIANNTYSHIKNALQEAKDKLGNLVIPDIIPDTVSLEKLGLTAPKAMNESIKTGKTVLTQASNGLQKIAALNPIEILRGKLSDVCGLDLTAILDELLPAGSDNQTPLFEINKLVNKISDEFLNSEVYKDVHGKIVDVKKIIEKLEKDTADILEAIGTYRLLYNNSIKAMSDAIPSADDLRNVVKTQLENLKSNAFNFILENKFFNEVKNVIESKKAAIQNLVRNEIALLKDICSQKAADLLDFQKQIETQVQIIINNLPNDAEWPLFKDYINQVLTNGLIENVGKFYKAKFVDKSLETLIKEIEDNVTKSLIETVDDSLDLRSNQPDYFNVMTLEFEPKNQIKINEGKQRQFFKFTDVSGAGFIQLQKKVEHINLFILKNVAGNKYQQEVAALLKAELDIYNNQLRVVKSNVEKYTGEKVGELYKLSSHINNWLRDYDSRFAGVEQKLDAGIKNAIINIKTLLATVLSYIDLLRKIDPFFYYTERTRIDKELRDVYRRINDNAVNEYLKIINSIKTDYDKVYLATSGSLSVYDNYALAIIEYEKNRETPNAQAALEILKQQRNSYFDAYKNLTNALSQKPENFLMEVIKVVPAYKTVYNDVKTYRDSLKNEEEKYRIKLKEYENYVKDHVNELEDNLIQLLTTYIEQHPDEVDKINEAKNLYKLLTSIKQQELKYTWNTDSFRDINLGIVSFKKHSNPNTVLKVDVKATTYFSQDKFPPTIERITTYSENKLSNFGIGFLNIITISFSEISFITGSDHETHFDVKIKDVKFDGSLSFVQAFQNYFQTIGKGLILNLEPDHIALGYSLPIPSIQTPAFSFFNLSLNFDLRVYFDKRPMQFGFSLAKRDSKFGIAATIYAGFGFFGIVADPKHGIVEIECSLEAGAWTGISIGPVAGEVKLAFGFYYRKNEYGVRLEGYIVAEGRLSVWVLEVAARIYLGIISENGVVEGQCTVTYSVKLGFIKKSFSGSFHKRIAGSQSNRSSTEGKLVNFHSNLLSVLAADQQPVTHDVANTMESHRLPQFYSDPINNTYTELSQPVTERNWKRFINTF